MEDVIKFIKNFEGAHDTFIGKCSYWFARILEEEFSYKYQTRILFAPYEGRFAVRIWDSTQPSKIFDIRGDASYFYKDTLLEPVDDIKSTDIMRFNYLMRNCRDFS